jgi:hypothetical protein
MEVQSQPQANSSKDLWVPPSQKRPCGVVQGVGPEFKPQYCQKKKGRNFPLFPRKLPYNFPFLMKFTKRTTKRLKILVHWGVYNK